MKKSTTVKCSSICRICGKTPLTGKDYFNLCRKCQPAWQEGRKEGMRAIIAVIQNALLESQDH